MSNPIDDKLSTADEAVALVEDNQTLVSGGFVASCVPETLVTALEKRFLETGGPVGLTVVYGAGQGDWKTRGINHLAHEGLLRRVIGGHVGLAPNIGKLITANLIEAYNFPQGVVCQLLRDIAAGRPGCITHVGLGTFIDPTLEAGSLNACSKDKFVERIELAGKTWLWYKAFPVHIALIRASSADIFGNLLMDKEAFYAEILPIAQAVHNCGGIVIAQVGEVLDKASNPQMVKVPGILVDKVVIAEPGDQEQILGQKFNPGYCMAQPAEVESRVKVEPLPMNERRIIGARACDEVPYKAIVNLGIGMPEAVSNIAAERGILNDMVLTIESGAIGGMAAGGLAFGASLYPQAIIDQPAQFDFYDGGGLDFAALGAAQVDGKGNVNVSKFSDKVTGVGGFINIAQNAKQLVFCGTFTTGGLEVEIDNGNLHIIKEGRIRKFVKQVEQVSFSANRARQVGQDVLYITERAVFKLVQEGIQLIEVAPGIDMQKDVLDLMDFEPVIGKVRLMGEHLFKEGSES